MNEAKAAKFFYPFDGTPEILGGQLWKGPRRFQAGKVMNETLPAFFDMMNGWSGG